ncbi:MAG: serine dehydratase subunit alpha family protein, partial [Chloroflexi bacterium]|nr:serine dehydratase subunit alpha family protein [Chloroflexota bacterium]
GRLPTDYARKRLDLPPVKISEQIEKITVRASRGIFKNALQVGIPYKDKLKGPDNAAAVGAFCDPARKLEQFADLNEEKVREAATLLRAGKVNVIPDYEWDEIRIEAEVITSDSPAIAIIRKEHTNIAHIKVNGEPVFDKPETPEEIDKLAGLQRLGDFIDIIEEYLPRQVNGKSAAVRIEKALKTNYQALLTAESTFSELGRKSLGMAIKNSIREGALSRDYVNLAREKVSLAVEGRMAGFNMKVMTCAGSGNQGLVATLPLIIVALAEFTRKYPEQESQPTSPLEVMQAKTPADWQRLIRATGLVYLIANYMSLNSGRLSASCGCDTTAGIGATAGIAYFLTPDSAENRIGIIGQAINNMGGSIIGMVCDGGKEGCALKAAAATGVAVESALLACREPELAYINGIVNKDALITLQHISGISRAMKDADRKIIEFLQDTPSPP